MLARSTSTALRHKLWLPAGSISFVRPGGTRAWSSCAKYEARRPTNERLAKVAVNPKMGLTTLLEDDKSYYRHSRPTRALLDKWKIEYPSEKAGWTELALRALRERLYRTYRHRSASQAAQATVDNQWWESLQEIEIIAKQQVDLSNPNLIRDSFYFGGVADLDPQNHKAYQDRGRFSLEVAFHLGDLHAPIFLARHDLAMASPRNPYRKEQTRDPTEAGVVEPIELSPAIVDHLREVALCRRNWEAMTVYLDYMLRRPCKPEVVRGNLELARDLVLMVNPSHKASESNPALERFEPSWYLLEKAADQFIAVFSKSGNPQELKEAQDIATSAIASGVSKWEDMRAVGLDLKFGETLSVGSDKWLTYTTYKAMAGDEQACFALGDYYIRKEGWHPHTRQQSPPGTRMGLWWLEASASAALDQPELFARRHLLIALLLDEHGFHRDGTYVLVRGLDLLADLGASANESAARWLKSYASVWHDVGNWHRMPQIGKEWSAADKSMDLLNREDIYKEPKI